jgi:MerR family transcriptional regulator, light-induced transcriptional regulator
LGNALWGIMVGVTGVVRGGQTVSATRFAQLTGVSRERLRTWERRFGFPQPVRQGGGPRRYLQDDVARVVAVRRAAEDGTPLAVAIEHAGEAGTPLAPPGSAFESTLELAPVPVALVSGPSPLRLEWANAALRAIDGAPRPGDELASFEDHRAAVFLREQFARQLPAVELEHPGWTADDRPTRSLVYRIPAGPGERPVVAVVGVESRAERRVGAELAAREAQLAQLRERTGRHDRWLDAIAAMAVSFQRETGPDVLQSALDALIRQTRAVDVGVATYLSGRLLLRGSHRGVLGAEGITVAAHPEIGRALRDHEGVELDGTAARVLGIPEGLHAVGQPIAVAGEVLGLLVLLFDDFDPIDDDNRRLLAAISAAVGFALLRDRLVRELRATVGAGPAPTDAARFAPRVAAGPRPGG